MGHNVGKAAERAVQNSERKATAAQPPAELIADLRKNFKAGLYIPTHQIGALLEKADLDHALLIQTTHFLKDATDTILQLDAEKKIMTDTIFGLTQKVQELQGEIDNVTSALHGRPIHYASPEEAAVIVKDALERGVPVEGMLK